MTTTHEDQIADDFTDLLAERGQAFLYCRGCSETSVDMVKQEQRPEQVVAGDGSMIEVRIVDFKALTDDLPYAEPQAGDKLKSGSLTWEVRPQPGGNKVFQTITGTVTRIHTVQVK